MKNSTIYQELQFRIFDEINSILGRNRILFFFTKGFTFSFRLYNDKFKRKSCDIDIFIHKDSVRKAVSLLCGNGYYPITPDYIIRKIYIPFGQEFTLVKELPGFRFYIDIHLNYHDRFGNNQIDYFKNIKNIKIGETEYPVMKDEFEYLYYIDHYFRHFRERDIYGIDMKVFLKKNPEYSKGKFAEIHSIRKNWKFYYLYISNNINAEISSFLPSFFHSILK